jgi:hypothetical protein
MPSQKNFTLEVRGTSWVHWILTPEGPSKCSNIHNYCLYFQEFFVNFVHFVCHEPTHSITSSPSMIFVSQESRINDIRASSKNKSYCKDTELEHSFLMKPGSWILSNGKPMYGKFKVMPQETLKTLTNFVRGMPPFFTHCSVECRDCRSWFFKWCWCTIIHMAHLSVHSYHNTVFPL